LLCLLKEIPLSAAISSVEAIQGSSQKHLDWVARDLENQLRHLPQYRTELLTAAQREDDATLQEILELTEAKKLEVKRLTHNTIRHSGISYEQTLVLFCDGAAKACLTLTNAPPQEAPFRSQPLDPTVLLGSVVDLGSNARRRRRSSTTIPCAPRCRSSWRSSSGSFRGSNHTLIPRARIETRWESNMRAGSYPNLVRLRLE
jgi:hypothetical protein